MKASGSSSPSGTGHVSGADAGAVVTVGVDPHRQTFTATVLDQRGGGLGHEHFPNTAAGHRAALVWALAWGTPERVGIEGASGLGPPLAEFLVTGAWTCRTCHRTRRHCVSEGRPASTSYLWALAALTGSPGARAHYDRRKAAGERHVAAQRNLFNRLPGILHHCLHTGQTYNEAIAFPMIQSGASAHAA